jgi:hypothetical protein
MAIEPQNLIQIQSDLQNPALVTNETLLKYANGANPQVPSFLALLEMNRRKQIDEGGKSYEASNQASIKDQIASRLTQPTQTATGITANPFNTNMGAAPQGIAPTANPFTRNLAQGPAGINPTAAPVQANTAPIRPITGAEGGLMSLPVDHFNQKNYAGGGIVAFAKGDLVDEESQLSSFPRERAAGKQRLSDVEIERAMRANQAEEAPTPAKASTLQSFEAIRAGLPSLTSPEKKTDEELFAERKAIDKMAGVAEDPYADVKSRQAKREARQEKGYEQSGMDRLIAQLSAFAQADPSRGFGYAGAVSADASEKLEREQNVLRDKEESAQIEFQRAVAKEEDARRRGDSAGVAAAKAAQDKAALDYSKLENDRSGIAAHLYATQESAETRRQVAKDNAAARVQAAEAAAQARRDTAQDPKDKLFNSIMGRYNQSKIAATLAKKLAEAEIGSDEYNQIKREIYAEMKPYFSQNPDLLPPAAEAVASSKPGKGPSWWDRNMPAILGGSPTVSFDQLPKN